MTLTAQKCITLFSNYLDDKLWFFNSKYSELDITIYAYLRILLKMKLPRNPLEQHIRNCTNLCSFMDRITKSYFSDEEIFPKPKEVAVKETKKTFSDSLNGDDDSAALRRIQVFSVIGAMLAMGAYAVLNGIVVVREFV